MPIEPKKIDLFKFFKSKDFDDARMLMCADYIILSYSNELQERIDKSLKGYNGLFIGELRKAANDARKALEKYDKVYMSMISDKNSFKLCDTTIDVTSALDETIEKNRYFLQQCYNIIANAINKQIELKVRDDEEIELEQSATFELVSTKEIDEDVRNVISIARKKPQYQQIQNKEEFETGIDVGFRTAVNCINEHYRSVNPNR